MEEKKLLKPDFMDLNSEFITENADILDWDYVSRATDFRFFPNSFFDRFDREIKWNVLRANIHMSNDIAKKLRHKTKCDMTFNMIGNLHSYADEPAIVYDNGVKEWFSNGKRHRENGPAGIAEDGTEYYFQYGLKHRDDGPAVYHSSGFERWYKNGVEHREDGPAYKTQGVEKWYYKGKLHRDGGPAFDSPTHKEWYQHGVEHRVDGPAYIHYHPEGNHETWYYKGKRHRADGPASTHTTGHKFYYYHDELYLTYAGLRTAHYKYITRMFFNRVINRIRNINYHVRRLIV